MANRRKKEAGTSANEPNREELFHMAVAAARNNQKQGARVMFRKILSEDKRNLRALMWMAKLSTSNKERHMWLERVLDLDPDNKTALEAMSQMEYKSAATRNRMLMRVGIGVYLVVVTLGAVAILVIAATLQV